LAIFTGRLGGELPRAAAVETDDRGLNILGDLLCGREKRKDERKRRNNQKPMLSKKQSGLTFDEGKRIGRIIGDLTKRSGERGKKRKVQGEEVCTEGKGTKERSGH